MNDIRFLLKSQTAERHGINNVPKDILIIKNLERLYTVFHDIQKFVPTLYITSGYRCLELNRLLKSPDTSQHVKGLAMDIESTTISNRELARLIQKRIHFDQLILEFHNPIDSFSGWCHISIAQEGTPYRKQSLLKEKNQPYRLVSSFL